MIIVRFTSGLGNQMYQYNFYRFLTERYPGTQVKADLTWFYANNDHHGYELDRVFSLGPCTKKAGENAKGAEYKIIEASKSEIRQVTGQIPPLIKGPFAKQAVFLLGPVNRILREKFKTTAKVNVIDQLGGDISNRDETDDKGNRVNALYDLVNNLDTSKDWYFTGFWIEERYVKGRLEKLAEELVFPEISDGKNQEMLKKIRECESVSIHVRRGDYLSQTYSSMFKSLGREYYEKAVKLIRQQAKDPRFFIFSDDPDYINEAFSWLDEKVIVDINSGDDSYRDMQLMTQCRHNIIANSTFSQWGSMLNANEGHLTVYPASYLKDEDTEVKTIPGWIRVQP